MTRKKTTFQFEEALSQLEHIITQMEAGDLTLEDSLSHFEKGIQLLKSCQKSLSEAQARVEILVLKNGEFTLEPFASSAEE